MLDLGLDALSNQKILKGIYYLIIFWYDVICINKPSGLKKILYLRLINSQTNCLRQEKLKIFTRRKISSPELFIWTRNFQVNARYARGKICLSIVHNYSLCVWGISSIRLRISYLLAKVPITSSSYFPNATLTSCPFFFHLLLGGFAVPLLLHPPRIEWKKVGNWSELHSEKKYYLQNRDFRTKWILTWF